MKELTSLQVAAHRVDVSWLTLVHVGLCHLGTLNVSPYNTCLFSWVERCQMVTKYWNIILEYILYSLIETGLIHNQLFKNTSRLLICFATDTSFLLAVIPVWHRCVFSSNTLMRFWLWNLYWREIGLWFDAKNSLLYWGQARINGIRNIPKSEVCRYYK